MRTFKYILPIGLILLFVSLACQALQPVPPTVTAAPPPTPTSPPIPAAPAPAPSPTEEILDQPSFPSLIAYSLFAEDEGVYIHTVDADGKNDIRLTERGCVGALPTWSTDGSLLAYYCYDAERENSDLWVMNPDGSEKKYVAVLPGLPRLNWSPDNRYVVYFAPQPDGKENDIYVLELASGESEDITRDSRVWDAYPDWSPDGDLIAFASDRAPGGKALDDIWVMKPDGSDPVNLTNNGENWEDYHPAWSPDGEAIAFYRGGSLFGEDPEGGPAGLWIMDADGGNQRLVTAFEPFGVFDAPAWSPNGRYLAYVTGIEEEQDVWVVPVGGGEPVNVSNLPGEKRAISWSPDSQALVFTNDDEQDELSVYIALPDGSDTHPLLPEGRYGYGDWSP
ncbi:MAG: PD40 domain-containing protein [Anaerolineales bacterium]|nr:PD40 domain-containing protein [Anaerolineales bacterium]